MKMLNLLACFIVFAGCATSHAGVVINEIFYNAPNDIPNLQWVELHNTGDKPVDISSWRLNRGLEFAFPPKSSIAARGFLVICRDAKLFKEFYSVPVGGEFKKSLKHSGATIELLDAVSRSVDRVQFANKTPWPISADGHSSSLERITPEADGTLPSNWTASPLPSDEMLPAGSPGQRNHAFSENLPPVISGVTYLPDPPAPGERINVRASVEDADGVRAVELGYQIVQPGSVSEEKIVAMKPDGGKQFTGEMPGQAAGTLVRFRIHAVDAQRTERFHPAPTDLRPAFSFYVQANPALAKIALAHVINTDPRDVVEAARYRQRARRGGNDPFGSPKRQEIEQMLQAGADLASPWLELTVNQPIDQTTYLALRKIFIARESERQKLFEESMSNSDFETTEAKLPARLSTFQQEFLKDMRAVLAGDQEKTFAKWYKERLTPSEQNPEGFLKTFVKIEGGWLALNSRFELSDSQLQSFRSVLKKALDGRSARIPAFAKLMRGEGDFGELQSDLGKVEKQMSDDLRDVLNFRQARFLQQWQRDHGSFIRPKLTETRPVPPRGRSAFILVDPQTKKAEVFDFVSITERSAGYKVRLHNDHTLRGMNTVNVIFEYNDRFVMAEPLAFDFYRRVGAPACVTDFVRLSLDGQPIGYHLLFEQVNRAFLRRNKLNPDGDLYKLIWYGRNIEGQHEKQTNPGTGHAALIDLIDQLNSSKGAGQWAVIEKNFDVDELINYFAVNMCLSHWDGYFNNYFAYHDKKGTGKWQMYPWDQDKTWGFYDSIKPGEVFFDMPITFGMEGDLPPGGGPARFNPESWWRPGGFFSKPLLANAEFRKRFLKRTREILEKHYTPEVMYPVIDELASKLRAEIPIRAAAIQEEPADAMKRFEGNVASLKENLRKRREFLLKEAEIKALSSPR
ncbi:MAG: hypothetical protein EXS31_08535 [Pedosphaera sp.]|nr:hypothetical protein [Pedosphaera sp.]